MTTQQFLQRLEELYKSNLEISRAKNKDYAGDGDPFKNFRLFNNRNYTSGTYILITIGNHLITLVQAWNYFHIIP